MQTALHSAHPKSGQETLAAPTDDSYVEIMEVHCLLQACYLDRRQLVDCDYSLVQSRCRKADIEIANH